MAASGLTFLQIVNRILERLRESTVAAYNSTDYSTMIAALVNQVKAEIEEAWHWHAMRETYTIATVAGTSQYALTGAGKNATVLSAWNTSLGIELCRSSVQTFDVYFFGTSSVQTGSPTEYIPAGFDANHDLVIDVWPVPTGVETLKLTVYVPQSDLAANVTVPLVPENVLIEETYTRALIEKGDESAPRPTPGETFILKDLLSAAVSRDESRTDDTEMDWQPE